MAQLGTFEKYMRVIEAFNQEMTHTLTSYDKKLQEEIGISQKQLDRLLSETESYFDNIILVEGERKKTYKMIKPIDIFVEAFDKSNEIGWFFSMAHEADPQVFKELEQYTNQHKHIYKFYNTPFEDINTFEEKRSFKILKNAVELHEYRDIKFYNSDTVYKNLKCLKLIFMDNNWYIAFVNDEDELRLGRISFIEDVNYSKNRLSFQPSSVEKHLNFIDNHLQNSMTLYGVDTKKAILKASPNIARYFEKDMKKFLKTETFIKKDEDGSVIFSVDYTQELEILPFVQKWLPDLEILEPSDLKEAYRLKLEVMLKKYKKGSWN
jgi:predicted DNA-binding transcriptional regulator YafY